MTDALALGEKLLALLEESARTTTYKPALLLALIDRAHEYSDWETIPVRALAERVIELYWPQTLAYPTTGHVLKQSQTELWDEAHDRNRRSGSSTAAGDACSSWVARLRPSGCPPDSDRIRVSTRQTTSRCRTIHSSRSAR